MIHIYVRVGILGPPVGFDPSGPSERGCWAKSHGTHRIESKKAEQLMAATNLRIERSVAWEIVESSVSKREEGFEK